MTSKAIDYVVWRDGPACYWCARILNLARYGIAHQRGQHPFDPTLDHLVPASRGGTRARQNLVLACRRCNSIRGNVHASVTVDLLRSKFLARIVTRIAHSIYNRNQPAAPTLADIWPDQPDAA